MELLLVGVVKASLILAVAQLLVRALPFLSAAAKHLLLTAGLAAFLVIPLLALVGPVWAVEVAVDAPLAEAAPAAVAAPRLSPAVPATVSPQPVAPLVEAPRISVAAIAAALWLVVAFCVVARLVRTALHLRVIVRDAVAPSPRLSALLDDVRSRLGIRGTVRLLRSGRVNVPMVWGVRSGTLLLPEVAEDWTDEHVRATYIHEVGHLQRLDYVSLALMNVVAALLWFHPQVWMARRRAITEGERACDDLVLTAGERASAYATHLLHVARLLPRREPLAALLAMSRPSQLEGRMVAILSTNTNRQGLGRKLLMTSIISFAALVVPLAFVQLSAAPIAMNPPARAARPAGVARVAPVPPAPPVRTAPLARVTPAARVTTAAAPLPSTPAAVAAPAPAPAPAPAAPAVPAAPVAAVVPAPAATPVAIPVVAPAPAVPVAPAATPAPPATPAAAPAAPVAPAPPAIVSEAELASRPYEVLGNLSGMSCTYHLLRPANTDDPTRNPAEALAKTRLLNKAQARGADAVTNVKCYRYIAIGLTCPSGIECTGDAVAFTPGGK
jgi:beta-lactamase regulating signal transducer with metallopeptidase domain